MKSAETNPVISRLEAASTACPFGGLLDVLGKPHALEILNTVGTNSPQRFNQNPEGSADRAEDPHCETARLGHLWAVDSEVLQRNTPSS